MIKSLVLQNTKVNISKTKN